MNIDFFSGMLLSYILVGYFVVFTLRGQNDPFGLVCKVNLETFWKMSPWWGLCWEIGETDTLIVAVVPINVIFRILRAAWVFAKRPFNLLDAAFKADYWHDRYQEEKGKKEVLEDIVRKCKEE
jgi:hypothetical protein